MPSEPFDDLTIDSDDVAELMTLRRAQDARRIAHRLHISARSTVETNIGTTIKTVTAIASSTQIVTNNRHRLAPKASISPS
jgi:hypothetical protein